MVVVEVLRGGEWVRVGTHPPGDSGSVSSPGPEGRQLYVFGWVPGFDGPGLWRSTAGVDTELGMLRNVTTLGLEQLADLGAGPCELKMFRPNGEMTMRFRLATR